MRCISFGYYLLVVQEQNVLLNEGSLLTNLNNSSKVVSSKVVSSKPAKVSKPYENKALRPLNEGSLLTNLNNNSKVK